MSEYESHPDGTALLGFDSDGEQHVWTVVRDGGMVTRGTFVGPRTAGIQRLYDQGPVTVLWSPTDGDTATTLTSRVRHAILTMPDRHLIDRAEVKVDLGYQMDPAHLIRVEIRYPEDPQKIRLAEVPDTCVCGNRFDGPNLCMIGACEQEQ